VTERYFVAALVALPFVLAAALWLFAFSLSGRAGRLWLSGGLYLIFEPRIGRHELVESKERPVYEDEPVTIRDTRTEAERMAAYAAMRAETQTLPVTVSAAPYTEWTAALAPTDLDELRATLEAIEAHFAATVDAAVAEFLRERTDVYALVPA
jgi:hypothetical protein